MKALKYMGIVLVILPLAVYMGGALQTIIVRITVSILEGSYAISALFTIAVMGFLLLLIARIHERHDNSKCKCKCGEKD